MNYLRDRDGNVYRESENPLQAWTPEEWQVFVSEVEAEIQDLKGKLSGLPRRKTAPDGETLKFWNAMQGGYADELAAQLQARTTLLEDLKKV